MAGTAQTATTGASANPIIPAKTRWCAKLRVMAEGGTLVPCRIAGDEDHTAACVGVSGADAATVILSAATSYRNWQDTSRDPHALSATRMAAGGEPYTEIFRRGLPGP